MKGTVWICLLLTLILALMGAQTLILRQKTQALEAMLRESEPGGAVLAALRAGKMEGSEST